MAKIIAITNNKGGVGKTTTTLNLGAALVKLGHKTLLIDLDPQANLTTSFGVDEKNQSHIGSFLLGEKDWKDIIVKKQELEGVSFDLLPSSNHLLESEEKLSLRPMREGILSKKLNSHKKDYDFILIDCPPSLGLLTNNALFASDDFIVPIQAEFFAYKGITNLINHILTLNQESGAEINFLGILLVKYNENMKERLLQGIAQKVREGSQGDKVFQSSIKQDKNLKESPLAGQDIFSYAPESNGAKDYLLLAKEILSQI
jgi:chromosome partitioning protein